jgi:CO/xanthine dehydrogenase Mo-binding subunit
MVVEVRASLDRDGRVIDWLHESYSDTHRTRPRPGPNRIGPARLLAMRHVSSAVPPFVPEPALSAPLAGIHRNADPLYTFSNRRIVKHLVRNMPLRTSTLRTLGGYVNVLAIESMMDELASAADVDPLEFRLRNLDDERARAVLEAAAERAGWRRRRKVPGRGQGLGFARYNNLKTYAAVIVELEVDDAAAVHLRRAVIAADAGQVVDAAGLSLQLEGGLLQAASWMLYEEVTWDERGITSRDWDSYPILRFGNVPEVETVLVDRPELPSLGAGEASVAPSGAAIANAIFDATGLRLRQLPFTPDAIRAAALD